MSTTTCCRGTYHRGADAVWRYTWGDPVPGARDVLAGDRVVGMQAPELEPAVLLTTADLAHLVGRSRAAVDSQVVRGALPTHQLVLDGGRRWARPIVERWLGGSRSRGELAAPGAPAGADLR